MIKNKKANNQRSIKMKTLTLIIILLVITTSCLKKSKLEANVENPLLPSNENEIITTMKLAINNGTNTTYYLFKDPDGDGGIVGAYGNLSNTLTAQSDSVITLFTNQSYTVNILLLDETKSVIDTISNSVLSEGVDHMFFFNAINPTGNPYSLYLTGSMVTINYLDLDANNRGIGLTTKWIAPSMIIPKSALTITLRHQPDAKDGTYAPGDSDIEVPFKIKIN